MESTSKVPHHIILDMRINLNFYLEKIFGLEVTEEEVLNQLKEYAEDKEVNGILVQMPIPDHIDVHKVIDHLRKYSNIYYESDHKIYSYCFSP